MQRTAHKIRNAFPYSKIRYFDYIYAYLEAFSHALQELPSKEVKSAWLGGIPKAPTHVHGLMIAIEDVQCAACCSSFLLQPLQKVQNLDFIVASVKLVANLQCLCIMLD